MTSKPCPSLPAVALIGAGPGDPELITLKAVRALAQADVVLRNGKVAPTPLDLTSIAARCSPAITAREGSCSSTASIISSGAQDWNERRSVSRPCSGR